MYHSLHNLISENRAQCNTWCPEKCLVTIYLPSFHLFTVITYISHGVHQSNTSNTSRIPMTDISYLRISNATNANNSCYKEKDERFWTYSLLILIKKVTRCESRRQLCKTMWSTYAGQNSKRTNISGWKTSIIVSASVE